MTTIQACRACECEFPYSAEADYCPSCAAANIGEALPMITAAEIRAELETAELPLHSTARWPTPVIRDSFATEVRVAGRWVGPHPTCGFLYVDGQPLYSEEWL